MARSFYAVLEIKRTASQDEVKTAFRTLAKKHHPDKGGDENLFKEITAAYATLGSVSKRRSYDFTLPDGERVVRPQGNPFGFGRSAPQWHPPRPSYSAADFSGAFDISQDQFNRMMNGIMHEWARNGTGSTKPSETTAREEMIREQRTKAQAPFRNNVTFARAAPQKPPQEIYYDATTKSWRARAKMV